MEDQDLKQTKVLIQGKNIYKTFYKQDLEINVLKGIDIEIKEGEFIMLFGPSGCGKTTLLNLLLGLEIPTQGSVNFLGKNLNDLSNDEKSKFRKSNIGIIYQQANWIRSLSVAENVAFPLMLLGIRKEEAIKKALDTLEKVKMVFWARHYPTELSSGQQQKIALARALVTNPKIIFADEPAGNLDYHSGKTLMTKLQKLNKTGVTVIMVTHNLAHLVYCTKIFQMFDGRIIEKFDVKTKNISEIQQNLIKSPEINNQNSVNSYINIDKFDSPQKTHKKKLKFSLNNSIIFFIKNVVNSIFFIPLLIFYIINQLTVKKSHFLPLATIQKFLNRIVNSFYSIIENILNRKNKSIRKIDIFNLAIRDLQFKKTRSLVTIGGVALGIGFIVFLLSIGYGIENLVVNRIAGLEQRKQIDAIPAINTNIVLDDDAIKLFSNLEGVESVHPITSVPSNVQIDLSTTDVVTYGVDDNFFSHSDSELLEGSYFSTENTTSLKGIIVNSSLLHTIGVSYQDSINKQVTISIIKQNDQGDFTTDDKNNQQIKLEYNINGVIEEGDTPLLYIPIDDLKNIGITTYSQLKIVSDNTSMISQIREKVESYGFTTTSIIDSINQIEKLFKTARAVLWIIGIGGLLIAGLGMFNTLTISLIERTREIGLMKSVGFLSREAYELLVSESIAMGIIGGLSGIIVGFICGKLVSLVLSIISLLNKSTFIDITRIPFEFSATIMIVSALVGIITGYYPAKRAIQISPMDALRYE